MIKITGLRRVFDQRGIAGLHDLSLSINAGEIFSVLGPNGSGKSTLLKLISSEISSDRGTIALDGSLGIFRPSPPEKDMNVQNYLVSKASADLEGEKKIQLARDLADIFEFTFQLRQNFSQLSSGQAQKVMVAAELIDNKDIILLDEPFAHLDPHTREDILIMLFTYLRQKQSTVIWVTHDLNEAFRFSDRIGLLNFGKWEQIGSPKELMVQPRNLFVAKYLGHKNIVAIKHDGRQWQSPWGAIQNNSITALDALLIISENWSLNESGTKMKIKERLPSLLFEKFILESELGSFVITFPMNTIPESTTQISVSPDLSQSIIIPL